MRIHLPQGKVFSYEKSTISQVKPKNSRSRDGRRAAWLTALLVASSAAVLGQGSTAGVGKAVDRSVSTSGFVAEERTDGAGDGSLPDAPMPKVGATRESELGSGSVLRPQEDLFTTMGVGASQGEAVAPSSQDQVAGVNVDNLLPGPDASFSSTMERIAAGREGSRLENAEAGDSLAAGIGPPARSYVPLNQCPFDQTHARECRVHVKDLVIESSIFLAFQNAGNLYTGYWYRYETTTGAWWNRYVNSVEDWRWKNWSDNNPFLDDYVGHPIMGAITDSLWIQNDPKGMTLEQSNTWPYYRSRLRALAFSTFYSFEWKLGPIGEASVGHNGDHFYHDQGTYTNETGWVELVTTPVGGFGWTMAEDALDKHVIRRLEDKSRNPLLLTVYQFLTPSKGFTNILRFRPPWYRDSREVKASGFWTDPGDGMTATTAASVKYASVHGDDGMGLIQRVPVLASPGWEGPGGKHEFGAWWGLSLISGHIWGYAKDVKYMPIDLRYSYELGRHRDIWAFRYSPELTALAMIDWPTPNTTKSGTVFNQRERIYGSGISPVGFQWDFFPLRRVQPFLSTDGGFIYFGDRVLSPQGSQFMYTIDFGGGVNIFRLRQQAVTIGFRYQHLSNADISVHNPGMDASTFYVGISRFRNRHEAVVR